MMSLNLSEISNRVCRNDSLMGNWHSSDSQQAMTNNERIQQTETYTASRSFFSKRAFSRQTTVLKPKANSPWSSVIASSKSPTVRPRRLPEVDPIILNSMGTSVSATSCALLCSSVRKFADGDASRVVSQPDNTLFHAHQPRKDGRMMRTSSVPRTKSASSGSIDRPRLPAQNQQFHLSEIRNSD